MRERKNRTSSEVTGYILTKRLNTSQLASLLGLDEFKDYHSQIIKKLQTKNGFELDIFNKIHSSTDCKIEENETEFDVRTKGYGKRGMLPLKEWACTKHGVTSITFIKHHGEILEGSFREHRVKKE